MTGIKQSDAERRVPGLRFTLLLLGLVALCLIPRLILALNQFIHYDGWWHILVARTSSWRATFEDIRDNAHPPLIYVLMHYLAKLGHSRLIYRLAAMIPGLGAVYYVGMIAAHLYRSRAIALLAATAFGFSMTAIDISVDVRSYSLALLFVLASFYYFLEWLNDPTGPKAPGAFLLYLSLASLGITTEYYSAFFLLATLVLAFILVVRYAEFRGLVLNWLARDWKIAALSSLIPLLTIGILYRRHIRYLPKFFNHVEVYYWHHQTGLGVFLLSNLLRDWNYFSPLALSSMAIAAILCLVLAGLVVSYALAGRFSARRVAVAAPGLILVLLLTELASFAVAGRYPFGGEMRQQSILFPFLVLAIFALLDLSLASLPPISIYAACALACVGIAADFTHQWKQISYMNESELFLLSYRRFLETFPHPRVVFTDQYSSVFYFIATNDSQWTFIKKLGSRGLVGVQRVYEFKITSPSGEEQILLRDKDEWTAELDSWYFYRVVAGSLRAAQVNEADLFFCAQDAADRDAKSNQAIGNNIRSLAARAGLAVDQLALYPGETFMRVHLQN